MSDPQVVMRLRFLTEPEAQSLAAAWPAFARAEPAAAERALAHPGMAAPVRTWCRFAGVSFAPRTRLKAETLLRNDICRPGGTVMDEAARVIAADALRLVTPRRSRTGRP